MTCDSHNSLNKRALTTGAKESGVVDSAYKIHMRLTRKGGSPTVSTPTSHSRLPHQLGATARVKQSPIAEARPAGLRDRGMVHALLHCSFICVTNQAHTVWYEDFCSRGRSRKLAAGWQQFSTFDTQLTRSRLSPASCREMRFVPQRLHAHGGELDDRGLGALRTQPLRLSDTRQG